MHARKWLLPAIALALVLAFAGLTGCTEHQYEKGPVKDDLIERGLVT